MSWELVRDARLTHNQAVALRNDLDWLVEHTDGMWFGGGLAVEPRYAQGLCDGMEWEGVVCG